MIKRIILIIGDIGSGKSASLCRQALKNLKKGHQVYTNFGLKLPKEWKKDHHRLKWEQLTDFDYWREQYGKGLSVLLDEFHNVADSRRSVSKRNLQITQWLAQIRKVLKGNTTNHLFIATQYLRQIDIRTRDLAQHMIKCTFIKGEVPEHDIIIQQHHKKDDEGFWYPTHRNYFYANQTYKYYDTHELIDFGKSSEYIG